MKRRNLSFTESKKAPEKSRMWDMTFTFSMVVFFVLVIAITLGVLLTFVLYKAGVFVADDGTTVLSSRAMFVVVLFLMFSSVVIGLIFARYVSDAPLRPFRTVIRAMDRLASGDFSVRVSFTNPALPYEFYELQDSFNKMAEELGNTEILRSDFVHNFSHEFKTPINSMRGFAKLLQKGGLTEEEQKEYLAIIVHESERLSALATNVLNLTKIENQTIATEKAEYDLAEQLRRTVLMLEPKWSAKNLEPDIDIPDRLPFTANADLLNQIWINLLDNAIKFSRDGGTLGVSLRENAAHVICSVRDTGIGMDDATKKHIFDKFYQGDTSHATEGNGIGLAVVKKIVDLYNGTIDVDSEPGKGSVFTVTLPK
jgi:signal transduction histidine kinase